MAGKSSVVNKTIKGCDSSCFSSVQHIIHVYSEANMAVAAKQLP